MTGLRVAASDAVTAAIRLVTAEELVAEGAALAAMTLDVATTIDRTTPTTGGTADIRIAVTDADHRAVAAAEASHLREIVEVTDATTRQSLAAAALVTDAAGLLITATGRAGARLLLVTVDLTGQMEATMADHLFTATITTEAVTLAVLDTLHRDLIVTDTPT